MGLTEYFKNIGRDPYVSFLFIIVVVKVIFIVATLGLLILSKIDPSNKNIDKLSKIQDKTHNSFSLLVSILLIYIFNPYKSRETRLDLETKLLIYLYGWITILTLVKDYLANR